jgi:predicted ATPase
MLDLPVFRDGDEAAAAFDAVQLFVQSARQARPSFQVDAENMARVRTKRGR